MATQEHEKIQVTEPSAKWNSVNEYCDTLEKLRNASYQHYLRRQTYEWKMCVTIWTPLVAMIGIILTKPDVHIGLVPLAIASLFILAIHIIWQLNLKKSNDLDLERARKYEKRLSDFVGVEIRQERKGRLIFQGWSHYIYVSITIGLVATSFFFNFSQREQPIRLPKEIQVWLQSKRHISIDEKEKYIIEKLREEMDSEGKSDKKTGASKAPTPMLKK